jgi:S-methylmethionine-dependent homocysteine/selenocysteine methylase
MNTAREAKAAATAARAAGFEFAVSFVTREGGDLPSGEPLEDALAAIDALAPLAVGLNCIPPAGMTTNLPRLVACVEARWRNRPRERPAIAAYAHIGNPEPISGWSFSQTMPPEKYAEHARRWVELGANIVGGCCGTTPEHIEGITRRRAQGD